MKTFFIVSLVLISILPIHYSPCGRHCALVEASARMIVDEEVINKISVIMNDGKAEPVEVAELGSINIDEQAIEANACEYEFTFVLMGMLGLVQQFLAEDSQYTFALTLYYLYYTARSINLYMSCINYQ